MAGKQTVRGFGLIVIGTEILDGRVRDRHFASAQALLHERRLELRYSQVLPDDPGVIEDQLRWAERRADPTLRSWILTLGALLGFQVCSIALLISALSR